MIIAVLGILKSGAAYLPLDPNYPAERLAYMLGDARPARLLTLCDLTTRLPGGAPLTCLDDPATIATLAQACETNPSDSDRLHPLIPANAAYVIYTSGSTGKPKGVV